MPISSSPPRQCSHVPTCELFPKFGLRGSLKVWHTFFCHGQFERCERYRRAMRGEPVSPTLLPNGKELNLDLLLRVTP
jgi:hypothetical protein